MKLTYWMAPCLNDSAVYSLRAKTRKAVLEMMKNREPGHYGPPEKVTIEYADAFDLVDTVMTEGMYGNC